MMFTSGTTGRPKGVLHTQAQVASNAARAADASALDESDVWLHAAPMFHAMDAFATYAMILVGGSQIAVGRRADVFDPREVARVVADRRVTVTAFAAAQLAAVLEVAASSATSASPSLFSLASLRLVSAGGSDVSPTLVREFLAARPDASFFVDYGMTEMGGRVCTSLLRPFEEAIARSTSVEDRAELVARAGRVAADDDAAIEVLVARRTETRDEDTSATSCEASTDPPLVSVAHDGEEIGEVVVRGSALFDGYWDPSTRTSTPPKLAAGGWFRTGDAATVDAHGWLRVVDRIKDVIIVGGENVFCGEVERALETHPAIERAAAYGVPDALLGETVEAAATLARDGAEIGERDLVAHCASMLAPFKVPRRIVILADMPTTATGKIRRHALRAVVRGRIDVRGGVDAVESSTERERDPRFASLDRPSVVALVRAELASLVPALATIDDDAPLAHAGLHSVAAVELSRRLNVALADATSETLPSLLVFDRPTVRAIADYVARDERGVLNLDGTHHRRVAPFAASSSFSAAARLSGRSAALPGGFAFGGSSDDLVLAVETQTATPRDRWDLEATGGLLVASDRDRADPSEMASIVTRHASYLAEDAFACDPEIVGAGVAELAAMDPSHRLVVLHAAAASVDARLDAKLDAKLDGAFTSVYVGCMWGGEWSDHLATNAGVSDAPSAAASTGSGLSFMAGRVAFTLNLRGACAAIDTACSSSLVATHMARESLVSAGGAHDAAVAAGVSVSLRAETTTSIAALGALSPEGRCKTFDASADGYGRGEGCVAFFVETFDDRDGHDGDFPTRPSATRSSDAVAIALAASTTNQDGRSASLTAPNGASQQALVRDAIRALANDRGGDRVDPLDGDRLRRRARHRDAARRSHRGGGVGRGVPVPTASPRRAEERVGTCRGRRGDALPPRRRAHTRAGRRTRPSLTRARFSRDAVLALAPAAASSAAEATAIGDDARDSLGRRVRGVQRVRHERRQRARRRGTGAVYPFSRRKRRKSHARRSASPTRSLARRRETRAVRPGDSRDNSEGHAAPGCDSRVPAAILERVVRLLRDGLAPRVRLQRHRQRGRALRGAAGLCASSPRRARRSVRERTSRTSPSSTSSSRDPSTPTPTSRARRRRRRAVIRRATRGKISRPSTRIATQPRGIAAAQPLALGAWNRDSGTTRESIASALRTTPHATRTSFPALVASKINPARRDEGRHPTDARGRETNILDAALHSTAALDAAFPKRTSSLRIPRSVDAFYASSNDAACSSSTFARASRSAPSARTSCGRSPGLGGHSRAKALSASRCRCARDRHQRAHATECDRRGMSRREADGTTRPDPTAYVSVALATPSTRSPSATRRRGCDFSRRIARNRQALEAFVDPSRTTTSTTSATIAAFRRTTRSTARPSRLNDADDGVPRDHRGGSRAVAQHRLVRWTPSDQSLRNGRSIRGDRRSNDARRETARKRIRLERRHRIPPRTSSSDETPPRARSSSLDASRDSAIRAATRRGRNAARADAAAARNVFAARTAVDPAATAALLPAAPARSVFASPFPSPPNIPTRVCVAAVASDARAARRFKETRERRRRALLRCDGDDERGTAAAANDAIRRRSNRRDSSPLFPSSGVANLTLAGGVLAGGVARAPACRIRSSGDALASR